MFVELYKYIAEENGAVVYRKYLNVYITTTDPYTRIFNGEVDYDEIDSFYYLNSKYIVCPKGKFHPLVVYATDGKYELDVGNNWSEKGDWELRCFHHYTGYFLVFYLMNEKSQFYRTKTSGSFSWTSETFHYELYDFKLKNGESNGEYGLAYLLSNGHVGVYFNDSTKILY